MSKSLSSTDFPDDDVVKTVRQHKDLLNRIADADLPVSDRVERALEKAGERE